MARKSKSGKFILSAGEISQYAICPESWRLRIIERKVSNETAEESREGARLHNEWASQLSLVDSLQRGLKFTIVLLAVMIIITVVIKA